MNHKAFFLFCSIVIISNVFIKDISFWIKVFLLILGIISCVIATNEKEVNKKNV